MIEIRRLHALTLISRLHPAPNERALIEITGLRPHAVPIKRYFFGADLAADCGLELNDLGYSVFVSINPRHEMAGFESSVPYVTAFGLDLQPERTSIEHVYQRLTAAGLPPSIAGISGGGAHAYVLLSEAADKYAAKLQWERLCKVTGSDNVFNVNRIFRMPGSVNWKPPTPRWCYLQHVSDRRYTLAEITAALDGMGASPPKPPKEGIPVPIDPPEDWFELRNRIREQPGGAGVIDIIDTGEKNAYSEKQITRSEADWVVVCALVRVGAPDEMIHWVYERCPVGMLKYRESGARYLNKTIESARRETAERQERSRRRSSDSHRLPRGSSFDRR